MADELPLHVQVAQALGWTACHLVEGSSRPDVWLGYPPADKNEVLLIIPHYDSDWSATGPLIEKYGIDIHTLPANGPPAKWLAKAWLPLNAVDVTDVLEAHAPTPLTAVCHLLLQLHKSGKLPQNV